MLAASAYFVVNAIVGQLRDLPTSIAGIEPMLYPVLVVLGMASMTATALLHAEILGSISTRAGDRPLVSYAYAASQLARYIPGKVFGVLLEAQILSPAVRAKDIVVATVLQTALMYLWAGALSLGILGAVHAGAAWPGALPVLALVMLWLAQRNRWYGRLREALTGTTYLLPDDSKASDHTRRGALRMCLLLAVQWLPFFAAWGLLVGAEHGSGTVLWLGASYLLASIGGSLLVLVPSGLVVREAAFIWLGQLHGLPAGVLLAWALAIRIALTLADVAVVPALWVAVRCRRPS